MRVDQIEAPPAAELSAQNRQKSAENSQWCCAHADLRQLQIAWTIDMQPVPDLLARLPGGSVGKFQQNAMRRMVMVCG